MNSNDSIANSLTMSDDDKLKAIELPKLNPFLVALKTYNHGKGLGGKRLKLKYLVRPPPTPLITTAQARVLDTIVQTYQDQKYARSVDFSAYCIFCCN